MEGAAGQAAGRSEFHHLEVRAVRAGPRPRGRLVHGADLLEVGDGHHGQRAVLGGVLFRREVVLAGLAERILRRPAARG